MVEPGSALSNEFESFREKVSLGLLSRCESLREMKISACFDDEKELEIFISFFERRCFKVNTDDQKFYFTFVSYARADGRPAAAAGRTPTLARWMDGSFSHRCRDSFKALSVREFSFLERLSNAERLLM